MTENVDTKDLSFRELLELMYREIRAMRQQSEAKLQAASMRIETPTANPLPVDYDKRFTALERNIREIKRNVHELRENDQQRQQKIEAVKDRLARLERTAI